MTIVLNAVAPTSLVGRRSWLRLREIRWRILVIKYLSVVCQTLRHDANFLNKMSAFLTG